MFDRTAIEPTALWTAERVLLISNAFGFEQGRLAVALPEGWVRDVYDQLEIMPDGIGKQAAKTALARLKRCGVVCCGMQYDPNIGWVDNALRAKAESRVEQIVAALPAQGDIPDLLTYLSQLDPAYSELFPHTIAGFESVCRRLVEMSPRATLVDPFIDITRKGSADLFRAIVAWGHSGICAEFDIYCRAESVLRMRTTAEFDTAADLVFESAASGRTFQVRIHLLDDGSPPQMHRRALITEHGGVGVDKGFRLERNGRSEATVLTGGTLEDLRKKFYDGAHNFDVVHTIVWPRH